MPEQWQWSSLFQRWWAQQTNWSINNYSAATVIRRISMFFTSYPEILHVFQVPVILIAAWWKIMAVSMLSLILNIFIRETLHWITFYCKYHVHFYYHNLLPNLLLLKCRNDVLLPCAVLLSLTVVVQQHLSVQFSTSIWSANNCSTQTLQRTRWLMSHSYILTKWKFLSSWWPRGGKLVTFIVLFKMSPFSHGYGPSIRIWLIAMLLFRIWISKAFIV